MKAKKPLYPDGVRVGRSSAGLGLFAVRPYKKGERIIEYVGCSSELPSNTRAGASISLK